MIGQSAFSPNYVSRSPFSPKYVGRSKFFKYSTKEATPNNNDFREIRKKNSKILNQISLNYEAYRKNPQMKVRAFESCDKKVQMMCENIKGVVSLDGYYEDERKDIVEDIKEARKYLEFLK